MSTYHFKTSIPGTANFEKIKPSLEKLQNEKDIDGWEVQGRDTEAVLQIVTSKLSPEEVKHHLREAGLDVEFTKAPEAK
jgi:hypothetical protein